MLFSLDEELDPYRAIGLSPGRANSRSPRGLTSEGSRAKTADMPRNRAPQPTLYEPGHQIENLSIIEKASNGGEALFLLFLHFIFFFTFVSLRSCICV